jgi:glutamine synthetase
VADGVWSGGTYVSWGRDTRETPMRICGSPKTGSGHFEFRPLDGTANPYVALAAILGAGSIGIKESQPLDIQPSDAVTPAEMDDDARKKLGIVDRLPLALVDARSRFQQDTVMKELLGDIGDVWTGVNEVCPFDDSLRAVV